MKRAADKMIIENLQKQILHLEGNRVAADSNLNIDLGEMNSAFPGKTFPRAAIHELISTSSECAASTSGFISVILGKLMQQNGFCIWIGAHHIYPPALRMFGIEPDRILFIDTKKPKDTLWVLEEALKCDALSAVVGELSELSFEDSRRLQLAVERSRVTGFIHRFKPKTTNTVACTSRWKISPIASISEDGMPGISYPSWNIQLLKIRNGRPAEWQTQWSPKGLGYLYKQTPAVLPIYQPQTA